jgi:dUTP pyrophosphatase
MHTVKIKKLHPDAVIPKYATSGSSGFDFVTIEDYKLYPGDTVLIRTGLSMSVGEGYELQIRPRSGLSLKTYLRVANAPGTVDSDYSLEISVIMTNTSPSYDFGLGSIIHISKGDRIAQGVICPVVKVNFEEVEELDTFERIGGFGSTGVNVNDPKNALKIIQTIRDFNSEKK